ncbi:MAG: hypothetical protein C5B48_04190 [Candidatus Rokuibacteriota bacterium]|nr:MAG: hypothetical protein C5B48_04190 [Candidatus Rokubacteria bacterium]
MNSTHTIKRTAAALTVGSLLAVAFAGPAQGRNEVRDLRDGMTVQQFNAVKARAVATDRYYRLGHFRPVVPSTSNPPSPAHSFGEADPNL